MSRRKGSGGHRSSGTRSRKTNSGQPHEGRVRVAEESKDAQAVGSTAGARRATVPSVRSQPSRRVYFFRRLAALGILLTFVAILGALYPIVLGGLRSPHRAPSGRAPVVPPPRTSAPATTVARAPTSRSHRATIPVTTTTSLPPLSQEPGGGLTLFPSHRLVAFYGSPGAPALGVLGDGTPASLWPQLTAAAAPYAAPGTVVVPTYELITFMTQSAPGPQGTYSAQLSPSVINSYLRVVQAHGGMLILDIQPGSSSFLADAKALAPWLVLPDVGLALDPEWKLQPGQVPDRQIGFITAAQINEVSGWLQQLTVANRLPQKLLMVDQFRADMVINKTAVVPRSHLAITFNMDGFGSPGPKQSSYSILSRDPRWNIGYKLFYTRDTPLQTPAQVLALLPVPNVIEYE